MMRVGMMKINKIIVIKVMINHFTLNIEKFILLFLIIFNE
jgi:hypothetical protein